MLKFKMTRLCWIVWLFGLFQEEYDLVFGEVELVGV